MQKDFHYYGIYTLARAAGINKGTAHIIANCSQLVDDSIIPGHYYYKDGGCVRAEVSAHHAMSKENLDHNDQRRIWIPFHFLPGGKGNCLTQRLICTENSDIAQAARDNALAKYASRYAVYMIGVVAHVYADTFAHYGFSGISAVENKIKNNSIKLNIKDPKVRKYVEEKASAFKKKYKGGKLIKTFRTLASGIIESLGALGHGAVMTYPDRPYLRWSFKYEEKRPQELRLGERNNPESYLRACSELFMYFTRFRKLRPDMADPGINVKFSQIKKTLKSILETEGPREKREGLWKKAIKNDLLFPCPEKTIPSYSGEKWLKAFDNAKVENSIKIRNLDAYHFFTAVSMHRNYVIKELLPKYYINVY